MEEIQMNNVNFYKTIKIDNIDIFYREAGSPDTPAVLLLHGFPTSSFMFRNLINELKDKYYLIAPDYPGFGYSSFPPMDEFEYSFENLSRVIEKFLDAIGLNRFSLYIQDYGAPVGLRIVTRRPEMLECLLVQNANAYEKGARQPTGEKITINPFQHLSGSGQRSVCSDHVAKMGGIDSKQQTYIQKVTVGQRHSA
jgi:pimeloyl-ACP methyl ester carboxylesterase